MVSGIRGHILHITFNFNLKKISFGCRERKTCLNVFYEVLYIWMQNIRRDIVIRNICSITVYYWLLVIFHFFIARFLRDFHHKRTRVFYNYSQYYTGILYKLYLYILYTFYFSFARTKKGSTRGCFYSYRYYNIHRTIPARGELGENNTTRPFVRAAAAANWFARTVRFVFDRTLRKVCITRARDAQEPIIIDPPPDLA